MTKDKMLELLKSKSELIPDQYDGSYEWMREIVSSYSKLSDFDACDIADLNAIYLLAVGTWKANVEKKKEYIRKGCLPDSEKDRLISVIDRIWDNASHWKYQNEFIPKKPSVGMFGTGFYSFEGKTTKEDVQRFISMLVNISMMSDDEDIFSRVESVTKDGFKGMGAAAASMILHCLKPYTFPILNGNLNEKTA